jgi:putative transposase
MIALSHKIEFKATCKQEIYFCKACGVARFAWNWGLAKWKEKFQAKQKTSAFELKKEFNALKNEQFPWVYEVTKYACQQPFIYLQKAFQGFFNKVTKYPQFKKKGVHDSFYIGGDQLRVEGKRVKIPNLGWVRLREYLRFDGKINGATVSRIADRWFISINVETNHQPKKCENQAQIGVDLGIKTLATLSNGTEIPNIKALSKSLKKLKRLQRQLSRKSKGSQNQKKAKLSVAKLHYKISCKRKDHLHKFTTHLTDNFQYISIEDLDVSKMVKEKRLSRQIMDVGFFEFRRQICYKGKLKGNTIFIADKWFASSKTCSRCGYQKSELLLSERVYKCSACCLNLDRDLNAAICLKQLINTVSSTEIKASGQDGSVVMLKTSLQPAWRKEELSSV